MKTTPSFVNDKPLGVRRATEVFPFGDQVKRTSDPFRLHVHSAIASQSA